MSAPLLDVARRINRPTLFGADPRTGPEELASFDALIARLRTLAAGRPLDGFRVGHAAYPDFAPFPSLTIRAGREIVATIADRWRDEGDVRAAQAVLQAAFRQVAA